MNRRTALAFAAGLLGLVGCGGPARPSRSRDRPRTLTVKSPPVLRTLRLDVDTDLGEMAVCEAVLRCGPAWSYRVGCNPVQRDVCRRLFVKQAATVELNPMAPLIAIDFRPELEHGEWFVEANGVRVWSPGTGGYRMGWEDPRRSGPYAADYQWKQYGYAVENGKVRPL